MKNNIVEISNVSKSFKNVKALDRISFDIKEHSIIGLLGPNGSGKSTLIRAILNLIDIDSGTIKVMGKSPGETEKNLIS
ncbi:MAG: ATP-binding cassette domain-containing protein [Prevotellaceae bacterium]|jgi:ABC-type multidrug transport system ATPase subunit|nr:ATP-binding cassette domain-containing protein [Prevotellaceae bacterium]